uniref:SPFH domain-containing protein n=1 Tax=Thermoflexus sp. TaxID=1969742 RepID=UPI002ADD86D0
MFLAISALCFVLPSALLVAWRASSSPWDLALGCLLGLGTEVMLLIFFTLHAAAFVERLYRIPRSSAIAFILRVLFQPEHEHPTGEVRDGDLTPATRTSVLARVGGPGALRVHESNLVLLERGGAFSRLIGPGRHLLRPFERPALVLDLRPQSRRRRVNAWTRDGLPVQTTLY